MPWMFAPPNAADKHRLFGPGLVCTSPPVVAGQILDRGEDPVPAGRADRVSGRSSAGASRRWIPGGAHADGLGVERRLPGMAEAVHCVNPEDQRNVQPRILDRVLLDHVVLVGPVVAGVTGAALAGRIRRVVRTARKQRARVVVDEPRLHAVLVQLGPALAAACVGRTGQVVDELLVHLADLLGQGHRTRAGRSPGPESACGHRATERWPGFAEAATPWPMKAASAPATKAPTATMNTAFLLLRIRPLACGVGHDSTSLGWG